MPALEFGPVRMEHHSGEGGQRQSEFLSLTSFHLCRSTLADAER